MHMHASDWEYRIEGNNHIIFSNSVTRSLLRLPKISKRKRWSEKKERNEQFMEIEFLESVIYRMLEKCKIHFKAEKVILSRNFFDELSLTLNEKRPKRFWDDVLDDRCSYGLIMPNFCDRVVHTSLSSIEIPQNAPAPVLSIEIRPKSCYVPHLVDSAPSGLRNKCHYCLMRLHMEQSNPNIPQTLYCPNDLYSNDRQRMKRALCDLISGTKRYFAARVNDEPIEFCHVKGETPKFASNFVSLLGVNGSRGNEFEAFLNLICASLQAPITQYPLPTNPTRPHCRRPAETTSTPNTFGDVIDQETGANVMQMLASIQNMRDVPMSEVMKADERVRDYTDRHPGDRELLSLDFPYCIDNWKSALKFDQPLENELPLDGAQETERCEMIALVTRLRRFIVSRIFSCCSLIVSMHRLPGVSEENGGFPGGDDKSFVIDDGYGNFYLSSIAILDLYKDPPNQIAKYYENEQQFTSHLFQRFQESNSS